MIQFSKTSNHCYLLPVYILQVYCKDKLLPVYSSPSVQQGLITCVHAPCVLQGLPMYMLQVYCKGYLCTCSKCTARVTCVHAPSVLQGLPEYMLQVYCKGYLCTCSKCTAMWNESKILLSRKPCYQNFIIWTPSNTFYIVGPTHGLIRFLLNMTKILCT